MGTPIFLRVATAKGDIEHPVDVFSPERLLARLNGATAGKINSSHHQAIDRPGENLRVTARASDGTIEGVEWTGGSNWVLCSMASRTHG